jgi:hypothetical protein
MDVNMDSSLSSLSSAIRNAFTNMLKEVHTTIPGSIVSFDPVTQSAEVQISIRRIYIANQADGTETKTPVEVPMLINVPVIFLRGGGWCITFPVKPNDECIVHFSERAIDTWRKNGDIQNPKDWRMHDYSDAICQVGLSSEPNVITNFDNTNMQIRNEEGDVSITINEDKSINVESLSVNINSASATFTGNLQVDGDINVSGSADIGGSIDITGTSTAADHVSGTVSGRTHIHPTPSGPSGVPVI